MKEMDVILIAKHPKYNVICTSDGDVMAIDNSGKILKRKKSVEKRGYVHFTVGNRTIGRKTVRVHRLVAETFLANPDNLPCIDHKDRNKANNAISNLRWVTYKTNNNNTIRQINAATDHQHISHATQCRDYYARKIEAGYKKVNIKIENKTIQRWIKVNNA